MVEPARTIVDQAPGLWIHAAKELSRREDGVERNEDDAYSLWYVTEGAVVIRDSQRRLRITTPCAILLGPGDGRTIELGPKNVMTTIRFDLVWRPLIRIDHADVTVYAPHKGTAPQVPLADLWRCDIPAPLPSALCANLDRIIIPCATKALAGVESWMSANLTLGQWLYDFADRLRSFIDDATSPTVRSRVETLVDRHLLLGPTVASIARLMNVTPRHLNRLLRHEEPGGLTAYAIIRTRRLAHARQHLLTDRRIAEVARICGYRSAIAFSNDFKDATGQSPSIWRKARNR